MAFKKLIKKIFFPSSQRNITECFYLNEDPKYYKYSIGIGTYGKPRVHDWNDNTMLTIGNYCSIARNVDILIGGEHYSNWITTYPFMALNKEFDNLKRDKKSKGSVVIGNDVWIGTNTTILSGVTIGNGAIIGAGSVVTKNIPSYAIYAGNPASLIKYRFPKDIIEELNKIKWWEWDEGRIKNNYHLLLSDKIKDFISNNGKNEN